jgi:hypothetical protein
VTYRHGDGLFLWVPAHFIPTYLIKFHYFANDYVLRLKERLRDERRAKKEGSVYRYFNSPPNTYRVK